jgi:hypothetical protein
MSPTSADKNVWGLVVLALLAAGAPARADEKVRVSVVAILASEGDKKVDRQLECIAKEVKKRHPKLNGFRMVSISSRSLPVGVEDTFDLVCDQAVSVTVQKAADKDNCIQLKVGPPLMGKITYKTACGKFLPIVTPYHTNAKGGGDLLIIAIRVQPCHGK